MIEMILTAIALVLTYALFVNREMMLGFPAGIFWFILGGQAYDLSTTTWDIQYFIFFASMFMGIFVIYAAFAVNRRDLNPRESDWLDSERFLDEGRERKRTEKLATGIDDDFKEWEDFHPEERIDKPSGRSQGVRQRAADRRSGVKSRKTDYRDFR